MNNKLLVLPLLAVLAACVTPPPVEVAAETHVVEVAKPVVDILLEYHRSLDGMSQADLNKELMALNGAHPGAQTEVRKAMVLGAMRDGVRSDRARRILAGVLLMDDAEASAVRPLVEWMINNNTELRRFVFLSDKQAQQLKESQRRFDQLSEKLEAMKRIESSQPASPIEIAPAN